MCDPDLFSEHYIHVLKHSLGLRSRVRTSAIHTTFVDTDFQILNMAFHGCPEFLVIESSVAVDVESPTLSSALAKFPVPFTVSVFTRDNSVVARTESRAGGPGELPRHDHLRRVLPSTFSDLAATLQRFRTELALAGIEHVSSTVSSAQPALWN